MVDWSEAASCGPSKVVLRKPSIDWLAFLLERMSASQLLFNSLNQLHCDSRSTKEPYLITSLSISNNERRNRRIEGIDWRDGMSVRMQGTVVNMPPSRSDWLSSVTCGQLACIDLSPLNFQRNQRIFPNFREKQLPSTNISRMEGGRV